MYFLIKGSSSYFKRVDKLVFLGAKTVVENSIVLFFGAR